MRTNSRALLAVLVLLVTEPALASVRRVTITKGTQSKSGIDFALSVEPVRGVDGIPRADGYSRFVLSIPAGQTQLKHLWRTELWILDQTRGRTVLSVPVALRQNSTGERIGAFSLSSRWVTHALLALRCGKNAPLAETIYQVELKSYVERTARQGTKHPSLSVFLVEGSEKVTIGTPLQELKLSEMAIFTEADIIAYDWSAHEVKLSDAAMQRLPKTGSFPAVPGLPFVVVVNGERIYAGAFFTSDSSASYSAPVIVVDPILHMRPEWGTIRIGRAYPTDDFAKGPDAREDARIRACLERIDKLRKRRE